VFGKVFTEAAQLSLQMLNEGRGSLQDFRRWLSSCRLRCFLGRCGSPWQGPARSVSRVFGLVLLFAPCFVLFFRYLLYLSLVSLLGMGRESS
jgi:hypothetical protein